MATTTADALGSTVGCSHIVAVKADASAKAAILNKYKTVVAWNVHYLHDIKNPAKRRKVSANSTTLACRLL
jgi:ubiquitin carboxyl-terminal hydrolase 22/27/51